jgi:hypothetical protein
MVVTDSNVCRRPRLYAAAMGITSLLAEVIGQATEKPSWQ